MPRRSVQLFAAALALLVAPSLCEPSSSALPALYTFRVVRSFPHDATCFTQGLVVRPRPRSASAPALTRAVPGAQYGGEDTLYVSCGQYGQSSVREVALTTGALRRVVKNAASVFGEGLALVGDTLLQLSWQTGAGQRFAASTLAPGPGFTTPLRDGWGLTNGPVRSELLATDGSATLSVLDTVSLRLLRSVQVTDGGTPVRLLNELEWIDGEVWANIWMTECVARIDPHSGVVTGWLLLQGLRDSLAEGRPGGLAGVDVLNGIAWDAGRRRLFLTGKYWPRLFQVHVRRAEAQGPAAVAQARLACRGR